MKNLKVLPAEYMDIEMLSYLRVVQQQEDWGNQYVDTMNLRERTKGFYLEHLNKDIFVFVSKDDSKIVGVCGLQILNLLPQCNDNGMIGFICTCYTDPEYRSQGVQRDLFEEVIRYAKYVGICELQLETDNVFMIKLCQSLGFQQNELARVLDLKLDV